MEVCFKDSVRGLPDVNMMQDKVMVIIHIPMMPGIFHINAHTSDVAMLQSSNL